MGIFSNYSGSSRPWLRNDNSERLFTLHLKNITQESRLDADAIWDNTYGGGSNICELSSNRKDRRLRKALDAHRKLTAIKEAGADRLSDKMRVFTDVVVWIPEGIWKASSREGGELLRIMSNRLIVQHKKEFGDELYRKGREPRYSLMPLKGLPDDELIIQFGLGVFIPSLSDKRIADVKFVKHGMAPESLPNWIIIENEQLHHIPSAMYEDQHFLLVGGVLDEASILSPAWFDHPSGYMMINTQSNPEVVYGDDEYIEADEKAEYDKKSYRYTFRSVKNKADKAQLIIQPIDPTKQTDKQEHQTNKKPTANYGETIIGVDDEPVPLSSLTSISLEKELDVVFHLSIIGLVLPKFDHPKIKYWVLRLNEQGMPCEPNEDTFWMIRGGTELQWCNTKESMETWFNFDAQNEPPFLQSLGLNLLPPILLKEQFGILPLPQHLSYPLPSSELIIGRAGSKNKVDMGLALLNQKNSIEWNRPTRSTQTMGHLHTSAKHVQVKLKGMRLQVQQVSGNSPTYILQDDMMIKTTLPKGSNEMAELAFDEYLLIGDYVLQFQREFIGDKKV